MEQQNASQETEVKDPLAIKIASLTQTPHKIRDSFTLQLENTAGQILPFSAEVAAQLISISAINQTRVVADREEKVIERASFIVWDDLNGIVCEALQELWEMHFFTLKIISLNQHKQVVRTIKLERCAIERLEHARFDYTPNHDKKPVPQSKLVVFRYEKISLY